MASFTSTRLTGGVWSRKQFPRPFSNAGSGIRAHGSATMTGLDRLTSRLSALATRPDAVGEREDLERTFAVIVRQSLRTGGGLPHVVRWVRRAHGRLAGTNNSAPPVYYAPQITRMLMERILERIRPKAETRPKHWSESLLDE